MPPESIDPATGEVWQRHHSATVEEVARAVAAARRAQKAWAMSGIARRVAVLRRFHRIVFERRHELAALIARENGKPPGEALAADVLVVLDYAASYARIAPHVLGPNRRRATTPSMLAKRITVEHVPHGVIGVIAPWNYPLMLPAGILIPALVAGNAAVLKPSELTTATGARLVELLHESGVPVEVVAVVPGDGSTGAALVGAGVDKVSFTGSVATGRKVAVACAERLIPCSLELGGSDPAIVLDDADVRQAARGIVWGRFSNAGQTCVAPKRVFVADAVYDRFAESVAGEVRALRVGPATDNGSEMGPLVRQSQASVLRAQLAHAMSGGATTLAESQPAEGLHDGWMRPVVIEHATMSSRVMREETFGPVLPLIRVKSEEEAVRLANDSELGLSASVWSGDTERAACIARQLDVGTVTINDVAVAAGMADVPHGGVKQSGMGRAHGREGLLEMVRTRTIVESRVRLSRQPWWFPYGPDYAVRFDTFVRLLHGRLAERMRALIALPGALRRR